MDIGEVRDLIAEYFDNLFGYRVENINKNGLTVDDKNSYREAIRHLKADIARGNSGALDIFTPVDNFKTESSISAKDWDALSTEILPLLRKHSVEQLEKVIEYGDKKNQADRAAVLAGNQSPQGTLHFKAPSENTISITDAVGEFIQQRSALGAVGNKHIEGQKSDLALLCEIVGGKTHLSAFDGVFVRRVRDVLIALPTNRNKRAQTKNLSVMEAIKVEGIDKIPGKTVNGYLGTYRTFFKWIIESRYLEQNPFEAVRVEYKKAPVEERRQAYSQDALQIAYTALVHRTIKRDSYKWASLIGMFTGARLAEICQLELSDIQEHSGIVCFEITGKAAHDGNFKSLKSDAASRIVPIHSTLIELGIGAFARSVREKHGNGARLFHDFRHHKDKGYTKNFGRWYNESFTPKLGIKSNSHIFHGLRHTMNTRLLQANVEPTVVQMLLGHARQGVQAGYFAQGYKVGQLKDAIEHFEV